MQQNHLFIMDPIEKLNLELDSSLRIAFELSKRHAFVYFAEINDLFWETGKAPQCRARSFSFNKQADKVQLGETKVLELSSFSSIQMRKDPPFDMAYITATWFLDHCPKTLVINHPHALRAYNEKLLTLLFPKECKAALVSSNVSEILKYVQKQCQGDAIIKPLDLYGGRGIIRLQLENLSPAEAEQALMTATDHGKNARLVQRFDTHIFKGEIRVFTLDGEPLSWCLKVPHDGNFLANTRAGASLEAFTPSQDLIKKVSHVASELVKKGVWVTGMDLINEEISEINITSPRLLHAPGDTRNYFAEITDWLIKKCK